jgi:hypothetical protein
VRLFNRGVLVGERTLLPLTRHGEFPSVLRLAAPGELFRLFRDEPLTGLEWSALSLRPDSKDRLGVAPRELALVSAACLVAPADP